MTYAYGYVGDSVFPHPCVGYPAGWSQFTPGAQCLPPSFQWIPGFDFLTSSAALCPSDAPLKKVYNAAGTSWRYACSKPPPTPSCPSGKNARKDTRGNWYCGCPSGYSLGTDNACRVAYPSCGTGLARSNDGYCIPTYGYCAPGGGLDNWGNCVPTYASCSWGYALAPWGACIGGCY